MFFKHSTLSRPVFFTVFKSITRTNVNGIKNSEFFLKDKRAIKINDVLTSFGFSHGQITNIFKSQKSILSYTDEDLISNIMTWQSFEIDNKKLIAALTRCTELITLNPAYIDYRVKELMTLFTKKDISKLLLNCHEVFLDEFEDIKEKAEYLVYFMGVEQSSIVKTGAMQFDLNYIKMRHEFMLRTGLYRMKKRAVLPKTAPLNKVFSRNIQTFLKLSGLSKEEYEAFKLAYKFEQEQKLIDEEDSDDEI